MPTAEELAALAQKMNMTPEEAAKWHDDVYSQLKKLNPAEDPEVLMKRLVVKKTTMDLSKEPSLTLLEKLLIFLLKRFGKVPARDGQNLRERVMRELLLNRLLTKLQEQDLPEAEKETAGKQIRKELDEMNQWYAQQDPDTQQKANKLRDELRPSMEGAMMRVETHTSTGAHAHIEMKTTVRPQISITSRKALASKGAQKSREKIQLQMEELQAQGYDPMGAYREVTRRMDRNFLFTALGIFLVAACCFVTFDYWAGTNLQQVEAVVTNKYTSKGSWGSTDYHVVYRYAVGQRLFQKDRDGLTREEFDGFSDGQVIQMQHKQDSAAGARLVDIGPDKHIIGFITKDCLQTLFNTFVAMGIMALGYIKMFRKATI